MVGPEYSRPPLKTIEKYQPTTQTEFTESLGENSNKIIDSIDVLESIIKDLKPNKEATDAAIEQINSLDVTSEISGSSINGYITMSGITGTTFQIDQVTYDSAPNYNLANYIDIPENGQTDYLNFGDEYYFYGNIETDISATIYEMKYLVNLGRNQFTNTSNPTWMSGTTSYVTEIGLYNAQKDLMVISKLQSPELRQGIQQFVVKLDF
jgi:hypothetical protein